MKTLLLDTAHAGSRRLHALGLFLVGAFGLLLYGHTLPFPFVFDDYIYLVDNPLMKDIRSFMWNGDFTQFANLSKNIGLDPDVSTNMILRPVTYFTFYLNYLVDGLNPRGFRAVNILIHCANAILLLAVVSRVLHSSKKRGALSDFSADIIAISAALLFLVHPLQIESVTYIVQRFTSLGTLFYLLTILTFLRANITDDWQASGRWRTLSVVCLIVGMFTKEFLFTAPFLLFFLDWLVMGATPATAGRRTLPFFICLPLLPILIFFTATAQNAGDASLAATLNITKGEGYSSYFYALTQVSVVLTYLRLILLPTGLNLDWDYPLATSPWHASTSVPALLIATLLGGAIWWYRHHSHDVRHALLCLGIGWFFLTISIDSSIVPLPDLLCEHRSYLPSMGIFFALAAGAHLLHERLERLCRLRLLVPALLATWMLVLATATNARQHVWSSEINIWKDAASKSPQKNRPWFNLGVALFEKDRLPEASLAIRKAIALKPNMGVGYRNLGCVENGLGRHREALEALRIGVQLMPRDVEQHFEMGKAYACLGEMPAAEAALKIAIGLRPDHRPAHLALGSVYYKIKRFDLALEEFRMADSLKTLDSAQRGLAEHIAQLVAQQHAASY